jgi:hypothetical protein
MALLQRTVAATGAANVALVQADLSRPLPFTDRFDCVVVDAPCSGLGTLRLDTDILWHRHEDDLRALADDQLGMLRHAAAAVVPGGSSTRPARANRRRTKRLSAFLSGIRLRSNRCAEAHPALPPEVVGARPPAHGGHRHSLEAFFGAVMERQA